MLGYLQCTGNLVKKVDLWMRGTFKEPIRMSGEAQNEIVVHTQPDVEALVQAAIAHEANGLQHVQVSGGADPNTVQLLVDTCSTNVQERLYMCTDCNLGFYGERGEEEWRWHLRQHRPHKCDLCSEAFMEKDTLKTHMRTHTMQMPYICEKCGSAYSLKNDGALQKHMKACHIGEPVSVFQCDQCQKTFQHQKNLAQHMKLHQGNPKQFKCPECPATYSYKCHLTRHLMIHTGDKPYKCKICSKAFNRNAHLVRHRKIHSEADKEWKCSQCGFAFWERSDLLRHIRSHEGNRPFTCEFCSQTFVWKRYMYKHLLGYHKEENRHFCPDCCKCLDTEEALVEHESTVHANKRALTHTCEICDMEFHFKYKLDEHMFQHTGRKAHSCNKCSEKFISKKELDRHLAEHSQVVSFSCNPCEKSFETIDELQRHIKIHVGTGRFLCSICSQTFKWKSQLTNHMAVHSNIRDFTCTICMNKFKRKRDLTRHIKVFHDTNPPFTCTDCNEDFHSAEGLHSHNTETHWKRADEIDNYFSCTKCSGMFKIKRDLDLHVSKVHPPRPYLCKLCSKRFTMMKFLSKHFELKHEDVEMIEDTNFVIKPQNDVHIQAVRVDQSEYQSIDELIRNATQDVENHMETEQTDLDKDGTMEQEVHMVSDQNEGLVFQTEEINGTENLADSETIVEGITEQPMSEAITLAQLSQQVTNEVLIPVFLQENSQEQQIHESQHVSLNSSMTHVTVQTSAGNQTKPQIISIGPKVVKVDNPQTRSLLTQSGLSLQQQPVKNRHVNAPKVSTPQCIKIIRQIQNSGGIVQQSPPPVTQQIQIRNPRTNQHMVISASQSQPSQIHVPSSSLPVSSVAHVTNVASSTSMQLNLSDFMEVPVSVVSAENIEHIENIINA
ncbi:ZN546-like protein [Mya arenaria]|uniref:ZN546-like protein n=1 Tax=Mya arenaria TaxID=6604 RepID=A0ABY7FU39_MYAAR|nr:ZN546-like protein [Mya arenaria]